MNSRASFRNRYWLLAGVISLTLSSGAYAATATVPDAAVPADPAVTTSAATPAAATQQLLPFVVKHIRIDGLQRLPVSRVYGLLPIEVGDKVGHKQVAAAIQALYRSGDFEDVRIGRGDNSTLVVVVSERPSIAKVEIKGNKAISSDDLRKGLKQADLLEGDVYKRSTLKSITGELTRQYVAQGRYDAHVDTKVTPLPRNRVELTIEIYEGSPARIKDINIVGNKAFDDATLLEQFKLQSSHFTSFFKGDDKYSRQKLSGDLESLRSWYMDHGYIEFGINSVQVSVTPDREHVFITVNVKEGQRFKVGKVSLAGDIPINREQLKPLLIMKQGQVYSQQIQTYTSDLLTRRLGNAGYTFAKVKGYPKVNKKNLSVDVSFFVEPGNRVYVNNISFSGNNKTEDHVMRREMRQFEAAPANTSLIDLSKQRLQRLGFFGKVTADTKVVPGSDDLVNINYDVDEQPSGSIGANIGYSDANGVIFGASVSQNNFLGSGDRVAFSFRRSDVMTNYSFSHYDPYYTPDGVSRGFSLHYSKINYDNSRVNIASYAADRKGGAVTYGYPISEYSRVNFGFGLENIDITNGQFVPESIYDYMQKNGHEFNEFSVNLGVSTSTLNSGILPDRGWSQSLNLQVATPAGTVPYYKVTLNAQRYFPLAKNWVLRAHGKIGYGDGYGDGDGLPFFENFYSGGIGSVRGYQSYSLGPRSPSHAFCLKTPSARDCGDSSPEPVGGNALIEASAELIFPTPFAPDSRNIRTFLFFDAGNVYNHGLTGMPYSNYLSELRYSAGIGVTWLTAIGPLSFDLGRAINPSSYDDTEVFQFSLGQTF